MSSPIGERWKRETASRYPALLFRGKGRAVRWAMQHVAMGDAMRCVGRCSVLRFLPRLCALFVICRPSALPCPFLLSRQLSSCLFSIPFSSFINFLSFSLRSFPKRNAARCSSPRSILVFPLLDRWGWSGFAMYEGADGFPFAR